MKNPRHLLHGRRVVVTWADHPTGLGAGRALWALSAGVLGLTSRTSSPACSSKSWQGIHAVGRGDSDEEWMKAIITAGRTVQPGSMLAFLLPTQDLIVELASRRRSELEPYFRFKLPPHAVAAGLSLQGLAMADAMDLDPGSLLRHIWRQVPRLARRLGLR